MSALVVLMSCSLLVALGFLAAFIVSARSGQFDDTTGPAVRMLSDDTALYHKSNTPDVPLNTKTTA